MEEIYTTIRVEKEALELLHRIMGYLNWTGKTVKHDLNDTIVIISNEYLQTIKMEEKKKNVNNRG